MKPRSNPKEVFPLRLLGSVGKKVSFFEDSNLSRVLLGLPYEPKVNISSNEMILNSIKAMSTKPNRMLMGLMFALVERRTIFRHQIYTQTDDSLKSTTDTDYKSGTVLVVLNYKFPEVQRWIPKRWQPKCFL